VPALVPSPAATAEQPGQILFSTSGSTGAPRCVLTTHRMLSANQHMTARCGPFPGRRAAGHRWTGGRESHLRRQPQPDLLLTNSAPSTSTPAGRCRPVPGQTCATWPTVPPRVLQTSRRVRAAGAGPGCRSCVRLAVLLSSFRLCQTKRGAALPAPCATTRLGEAGHPGQPVTRCLHRVVGCGPDRPGRLTTAHFAFTEPRASARRCGALVQACSGPGGVTRSGFKGPDGSPPGYWRWCFFFSTPFFFPLPLPPPIFLPFLLLFSFLPDALLFIFCFSSCLAEDLQA